MKYISFLCMASLAFMFTSCDDDDPIITDEPELITDVQWRLTPLTGGDIVRFSYSDDDGDGGDPAIVTTAPLVANTTYSGSLTFANESETPAEDITIEIMEEDDDHQVFFTSTKSDTGITYLDSDDDGNPIGLLVNFTTGAAGTGEITITLQHEPMKDAEGVSEGQIANAGGETDIEVVFDLVVE